jgi:hypothetical protein
MSLYPNHKIITNKPNDSFCLKLTNYEYLNWINQKLPVNKLIIKFNNNKSFNSFYSTGLSRYKLNKLAEEIGLTKYHYRWSTQKEMINQARSKGVLVVFVNNGYIDVLNNRFIYDKKIPIDEVKGWLHRIGFNFEEKNKNDL